jgi:hypothetical protein
MLLRDFVELIIVGKLIVDFVDEVRPEFGVLSRIDLGGTDDSLLSEYMSGFFILDPLVARV